MPRASELFPAQRKTPLPGGYMGRILRLDLTTGSTRDENLPEEPVLRKFIGGQALANYILLKELPTLRRGRGPGEVRAVLRKALLASGFAEDALEDVETEVEAAERALAWAEPGDLLVLLVHEERGRVLELLRGAEAER